MEALRVALVGTGMIPIPPPGYGAVEKHIWNLARGLEALGHTARVVSRVVGPRSRHEYRFALWARGRLATGAQDVVHVHTPGVAFVLATLGPRRFVYTTHSRHWMTTQGIGERVGLRLERRAVRHARATIAVSPRIADAVGRPVHVIPNGVDVSLYRPRPGARQGHRAVGLGAVVAHKRWHVAAEALQGTPWRLTLVGPVVDEDYARRVVQAAPGRVDVRGVLPEEDLARVLGESDALIHPSRSEGLPMAVLEGLASGLPVLGSEALTGLVSPETGVLVAAVGDEEAAAYRQALLRLGEDGTWSRRLADAARAKAEQEFAWPVVASAVAQVYRRAVQEPGRE